VTYRGISVIKRAVYNLHKLTHGLTIPTVCSSLIRQNYFVNFVSLRLGYIAFHLPMFIERHFMYCMCLCFIVISLRSVSDCNKETTYLSFSALKCSIVAESSLFTQ